MFVQLPPSCLISLFLLSPALALAVARDGSSGGVIRMAVITGTGVERAVFTGNDIPQFYSE